MAGPGADLKGQVLQATDIVELVSQTVTLKRSGRGFTGLCPFHQEKTPSFSVNPTRQFFYCFGCKAGGNAIDFVMKRDRIEFVEAMHQLAEKAGIAIPKFDGRSESASERQLLLDAQSAACAYFQDLLRQPQGQPAREYLDKRGFNADAISKFQIGMATNGWDGLLKGPVGRKFAPEALLKAGLLKHNEERNSYYDTFRNRLMFPIRDEQSRVIAFGGRVMPGSDDPAKYLNSPETPIFSKGRCIFGLDLARQRIVETRTVVIAEGYTDAIMCHQFGVTNVVSALGTALTGPHVNLLRRYADRIVLMFDPDVAGDLAVNRAVELFLTQPIEVLIGTIPEKLDPDEYLLKHGAQGMQQIIDGAQDALSYKWKQLDQRYRSSDGDITGQQKAVEEYLQAMSDARAGGPVDSLRWGAAVTRVSRLTGIGVDDLNRRFKSRKPPARASQAGSGDSAVRPSPGEPTAPTVPMAPVHSGPLNAQTRAERQILACLMAQPSSWHEVQIQVMLDDVVDVANRKLAQVIWDHQKNEGDIQFTEFLTILGPLGLSELAIALMSSADQDDQINATLSQAVEHIRYARESRERAKLTAQLRRGSKGETAEDEQSEVDALQRLSDAARREDPRRGF